jgi:hypothetical protein
MMIEQAVMALIETVGGHGELHDSLEEALKRRGVNLGVPGFSLCVCKDIGTAYTTPTFLLRENGTWEARAGIAIMGHTNMSDEDLDRLSPFDREFHDNYASGTGTTPAEAIKAMHADRTSIGGGGGRPARLGVCGG